MKVLALLAAGALFAAPPQASTAGQVPLVGRDGPDMDACGGVGRVSGLNPERDNFLSVRAAPAPRAKETDRLQPATLVWLCDVDGDWQGIVYASGAFQELGDCRVSSPIAEPRAYDGPCKSGWVAAKYLLLVAG